jgi:sulfatase maturation enzyme AslB (radical SAM superfamily)
MSLKNLTLMVTEKCNFHCSYCYHRRTDATMTWPTAREAIDMYLRQWAGSRRSNIFFYGGEPLINIDLVERAAQYAKQQSKVLNKKVAYSMTTNGSLLNRGILDFLNDFKFTLELSFDGTAQNQRQRGTFEMLQQQIREIQSYPHIKLMVNSVFTPRTIDKMAASLKKIMDMGVRLINTSLCYTRRWNRPSIARADVAYRTITDMALAHYQRSGKNVLVNFHKNRRKGLWQCSAGQDSLTVTASGEVWGCPLFYSYFRERPDSDLYNDFHFGHFQDLSTHGALKLRQTARNYQRFRMDHFRTSRRPCFLCDQVQQCGMCPITIAMSGNSLGKIPTYACQLNKIHNREFRRFHRTIGA